MSASVGYGRLGWNVGAWNTSPDTAAVITGQLIQSELNFGEGWGRESWSEGAWNSSIGLVLVGTGVIFSTTGEELNISLSNVVTTAATTNLITGQQATGTIGTYSIAADGTLTIVVPEFTINTALGTITTGTANAMDIVGQGLTSSLSNITTDTENFIPITGINANANVSSITISTSGFFSITGQEITIDLATIIPNSNNNINMTGLQVSVIPVDLRFWDPIVDDNTETWTNI